MSGYQSDWYAYMKSIDLGLDDPPFYGLLMAAMRKADTPNAARLRVAFPDVWDDLQARHNAPAGILDSDPEPLKLKVLGGAS